MNCDSCSCALDPRAGPDDLEHPQWRVGRDPSASDGKLVICHACDAREWDNNLWRQKAEPRPRYVPLLDSIDAWNDAHPIGSAVRYHPTRKGDVLLDEGARETFTRSAAWDIGGPARPLLIVLVNGVTGGVSVRHLVALS